MIGNRDIFVITDYVHRSKQQCKVILEKLEMKISENNIDEIYRRIKRANIQLKKINGREFYDIYGEDFGGFGDFVDENKTIVISL